MDTKIDDQKGVRNIQRLTKDKGSGLWFYPDMSMYVYYAPTHWRPFAEAPKGEW